MITTTQLTPESDPLLRNCGHRVKVVYESAQLFTAVIDKSVSYPDSFTHSKGNVRASAPSTVTTTEVPTVPTEPTNTHSDPNIEAARLATDRAFKNQEIEGQS